MHLCEVLSRPEALDPQELELQVVVSHLIGEMEIKYGSLQEHCVSLTRAFFSPTPSVFYSQSLSQPGTCQGWLRTRLVLLSVPLQC